METEVFLDTHALVWLYEGRTELFSEAAKASLESQELLTSPMALLELDYLYESHRITLRREPIFQYLNERMGLEAANDPFLEVINTAKDLTWTRDPFDRLITAHAQFRHIPLITKDRTLRRHYSRCIW